MALNQEHKGFGEDAFLTVSREENADQSTSHPGFDVFIIAFRDCIVVATVESLRNDDKMRE